MIMRQLKFYYYRFLVIAILFAPLAPNLFAQEQYKENKKVTTIEEYKGGTFYPVQQYIHFQFYQLLITNH